MYADVISKTAKTLIDEGLVTGTQKYTGLETVVCRMYRSFMTALFPNYYSRDTETETEILIENSFADAGAFLEEALSIIKHADGDVTRMMIEMMPQISVLIHSDIEAAYRGDPAAKSRDEIIIAYPAFRAVSAYRIAHQLHVLGVPIIPRILTEIVHRDTGIDIHPGASIGNSFFIDHGTGVVIGETCTIGNNVKLYQHVTLGAKSFAAGEDGVLIKDIKRHPDIGNDVIIYAGATILGGETVIGDRSVIGGNVWLTHSVEPDSMVTQ